jgi:hypothetical protein
MRHSPKPRHSVYCSSSPYNQPNAVSDLKPQLNDRGSANALPDQGVAYLKGAVIHEHGAVVE